MCACLTFLVLSRTGEGHPWGQSTVLWTRLGWPAEKSSGWAGEASAVFSPLSPGSLVAFNRGYPLLAGDSSIFLLWEGASLNLDPYL